MSQYFGLFEALFFFGLVFAFYVWQMRDLDRAAAKRKVEEAEQAKQEESPER
jgi:uncharacterized membrane protein